MNALIARHERDLRGSIPKGFEFPRNWSVLKGGDGRTCYVAKLNGWVAGALETANGVAFVGGTPVSKLKGMVVPGSWNMVIRP